ncbi:GTPase [Escherichia coli]
MLNKLLAENLHHLPQSANNSSPHCGIDTEGAYQAIYVDTPGLHMEEKRAINRLMNKAASSSIGDVELVIFVVEGTRWTPDDEMVLNKLRDGKAPVILRGEAKWITCRKKPICCRTYSFWQVR